MIEQNKLTLLFKKKHWYSQCAKDSARIVYQRHEANKTTTQIIIEKKESNQAYIRRAKPFAFYIDYDKLPKLSADDVRLLYHQFKILGCYDKEK